MTETLHIVCFDAPAPPDYGGAIDLFFKIKALALAGCGINLHYFQYKQHRGHQGLEPYCKSIHVYERKKFHQCLTSSLPFIVASRVNKELINQLNKDAHPVLLEGIHGTGLLPYLRKDKSVAIRMHNDEAAYYRQLAAAETSPLRNLYYSTEANKLQRYQRSIKHTYSSAAVSLADTQFFANQLGWSNIQWVPCFLPWQEVTSKSGQGHYALYHGTLSVPENIAVIKWLLRHVIKDSGVPFVIAGKNPGAHLEKLIAAYPGVKLTANPTDAALDDLIQQAQVNLLPSLNVTGVKIKLLHSLFMGRHCITNAAGVSGSGLNEGVTVCEDAQSMKATLQQLMQQDFLEKEVQQRKTLLHVYDNTKNAAALKALIYSNYQ